MKLIIWYQEIEFLISRDIFWGAVLLFMKYFLISRNIDYFLISGNRILDINKWLLDIKDSISWYKKWIWFLDIKKCISRYQEFDFLISRNEFLISRKYLFFHDIKKSNSWYQEFDFLISKNISWYQEFEFLILRKRILGLKKSHFWYQEIHFLISRN